MNLGKCGKCRNVKQLQKYSYGVFHWYFCNSCYISVATKVSSYIN